MSTTKLMTADELLALPDDGGRYELHEGVRIRMSPTGGEPSTISSEINRHVGNHVVPRQLGRVFTAEGGFFLARDPDTVVAPDIAFVRTDRLPPRSEWRRFMPAPDLAVEVVSPSDLASEVMAKVDKYVAAGVPLVWVVWPDARTVDVYELGRPPRTLGLDDTLDGGDVLPGFRLAVADVFR